MSRENSLLKEWMNEKVIYHPDYEIFHPFSPIKATLESFKLPVEENRVHLGKYAVRVEYEKNSKYTMVGIGLTKDSALFNACYKMLDKINA